MSTRNDCTCTCGFPRLNCLGNRDDCVFNADFGPAPQSPAVYFAQCEIKLKEQEDQKIRELMEVLL